MITRTDVPDATYPISIAMAAELTGLPPSTISTIARRMNLGRVIGRVRLLSRRELRKILAAKRDSAGRPPCDMT